MACAQDLKFAVFLRMGDDGLAFRGNYSGRHATSSEIVTVPSMAWIWGKRQKLFYTVAHMRALGVWEVQKEDQQHIRSHGQRHKMKREKLNI